MTERNNNDTAVPRDHERAVEVRARLVYLERYEMEFRQRFGRAPSVGDLERAIEQFDPAHRFLD